MTAIRSHIVWLLCLALLTAGCAREAVPSLPEGPGITLTIHPDGALATKAGETREGEITYNEDLIQSVDFLFYPGENPSETTDAIHHIRKEVSANSSETFNLVIKKDLIGQLFTEANGLKATVYALVNFERGFVDDLSETSRADFSTRRIVTDFVGAETGYIQPSFLMDGSVVVEYDPDTTPNATGDISLARFASKLTVALNVASRVELKHANSAENPNEVWTPVLHTMRIYLVDGVKSVLVGGADPDPDYFSYSDNAHKRAYIKENGTPYLNTETVEGTEYYHTYPMYSYPVSWPGDRPDYENLDYVGGLPPEPPFFKLEMDWRREAENGYSYDRRKYYYKIFIPANELRRNNWYGLYTDVAILGSETDEGKALLEPTCYLLDWQNKSYSINKYATISKARYLSLDKTDWEVNNMETLSIPFLSSHNVVVVPGSVRATRPYYGAIDNTRKVGSYYDRLHAWIRKDGDNYYLDFNGQPEGKEAYEPSSWLTNTSTSIELDHPLQNIYTQKDFDYSPYTIDFDIVHQDLAEDPTSYTYQQYLRHITITQYPGIYIERLTNRDTEIVKKSGSNPYGYATGSAPWLDKPWGYVFINGGRFVRRDNITNSSSSDPYYHLTTANAKKEYQWQTVWYTGGSKDIFNIHVTVLPGDSNFVIGDPREDNVNNLDNPADYPNLYEYTVDGKSSADIWSNLTYLEAIRTGTTEYPEVQAGVYRRTGFNKADALYGDEPYRALRWYYPTEKSSRTENMISPGYRISTKFGGTEFGNISKEYAEYRCAGYQEDGLPAGRWRLPTKAEVHFMAQLSANDTFQEVLFGNTVYWSANGAISVSTGSVTNSSNTAALLRCVYDSWYWDKVDGREGDPRQDDPWHFVWGDRER
ncbi:MAG: hypothetical protein IK052_03960 [Bacteroidales bacterium]|nr:hypothetical protein [Bacteroidales bacterium]